MDWNIQTSFLFCFIESQNLCPLCFNTIIPEFVFHKFIRASNRRKLFFPVTLHYAKITTIDQDNLFSEFIIMLHFLCILSFVYNAIENEQRVENIGTSNNNHMWDVQFPGDRTKTWKVLHELCFEALGVFSLLKWPLIGVWFLVGTQLNWSLSEMSLIAVNLWMSHITVNIRNMYNLLRGL